MRASYIVLVILLAIVLIYIMKILIENNEHKRGRSRKRRGGRHMLGTHKPFPKMPHSDAMLASSIDDSNVKDFVFRILDAHKLGVYGIKNHPGRIEWEIYITVGGNVGEIFEKYNAIFQDRYDLKDIYRYGMPHYISIDVNPTTHQTLKTQKLNVYYDATDTHVRWNEYTLHHDGTLVHRGDTYGFVLPKNNDAMILKKCADLEIDEINANNMLNFIKSSKLQCSFVSLTNKGQYIGIYFTNCVRGDAIHSILDYEYPQGLKDFIRNDQNFNPDEWNETGFYFNKNDPTMTILRTAVYRNYSR